MTSKDKEPKKTIKTVSFSIDIDLYNLAKKRANEEMRSFSNYLSYLIKKDLGSDK